MTASRIRWLVIVLIYGAFHVWYGGNGEPMTPKQVEDYVARAVANLGPEAVERVRKLASTDDGKEFVMVNLNRYRPAPRYADARSVDASSREVEQRYLTTVVPMLLARACHPIVVVDPAVNMGGEGDFERVEWDRIALARYRSRSDFLEFILDPEFGVGVEHKWAALEQSHTMLTVPQLWGVAVRLVPLLLLLVIGLLLDRYANLRASAATRGAS